MTIEGVPATVHVRGHVLPRTDRVMAKGWIQAVVLVSIFGFTVLGFMAARTYQADPPIPDRVVSASGEVLFTGEDVRGGQEVFLRNGLMQFGSIFGHGAYLGPGLHGRLPASCRPRRSRRRTAARGPMPAGGRSRTSARTPMTRRRRRSSTPTPRPPHTASWSRTTTTSSPTRSATPVCDRPRSPIPKTPDC